MLLHLIKKDILISKKYVLLVLFIAFALPLFILWRSPQFFMALGFALPVIYSEFILFQNLSMKESQYSKATALLCSTPYPRCGLVISKYIMFIGVFIYSVAAYIIDLEIFLGMNKFPLTLILIVFLMISIAYGIFLPIQYQLGYEKTKFFFMVIIMGSPFVLPALVKYGGINISIFQKYSPLLIDFALLVTALLVLVISAIISIEIFNKKELL